MESNLKKALVSAQIIFAALFFVSVVATFFVKDKIQNDSREIITKKVSSGISSRIDLVEELINTKKAKVLLADHQIEVIKQEITKFRKDPDSYVSVMTLPNADANFFPDELKSQNPLKDALIKKVFSWKQNIKEHFNNSFERLVFDIRLFLVSNVIGLLSAALISWHSERLGKHAIAASLILTGVIIMSSISYVNSNWLYDILLNSFAGMAYPVGILLTSGWLFWNYYAAEKEEKNNDS